jgi:hypothetical protein
MRQGQREVAGACIQLHEAAHGRGSGQRHDTLDQHAVHLPVDLSERRYRRAQLKLRGQPVAKRPVLPRFPGHDDAEL